MPEEKAFQLGFCGFVIKPVVVDEIARKIRRVLDDRCEGNSPMIRQETGNEN